MVGVPTLLQLVIVWVPVVMTLVLSLFRWNGILTSTPTFVGLDNYRFIVVDYTPFWPALSNNLLWIVFISVIGTPLGILLAVLLDQGLRGSRIYQSIFFIPVMLSTALVGVIWGLVYSKDNGLLNFVLGTAGTPNSVDWLGNSDINIWAAMVATTWRYAGYVMILYLAGLRAINPEVKEAAALDGAGAFRTFTLVVFPMMRPVNVIVVVITIVESLRAFDLAWVINRGTNGLELLNTLVIQNLTGEGQVIGVGSALAAVLLVLSLVPIVVYLARTFSKEDAR